MTFGQMPKGLKIACWIVAIALIVSCDLVCISPVLDFALGDGGVSESGSPGSEALGYASLLAFPLYLVNLVLGIVVAAKRYEDSLRTVRAIMLAFKLGLIPFFIGGALVEFACLVAGFHPIFPGMGWVLGFMLGVFGWFVMLSGAIWAFATALDLRRARVITAAELALHIILQFFFVADVVDAIILFVRCGRALKATPEIPQPQAQTPASQ